MWILDTIYPSQKGLNYYVPSFGKEIPYAGEELPAFRPFTGQRVEFLFYLIRNSNSSAIKFYKYEKSRHHRGFWLYWKL